MIAAQDEPLCGCPFDVSLSQGSRTAGNLELEDVAASGQRTRYLLAAKRQIALTLIDFFCKAHARQVYDSCKAHYFSEGSSKIRTIPPQTPHSHRFLIDTLMPVLYKARAFNESPDVSRK